MSAMIYKCPHCGSVLEYDAEKYMMTCDHCNSTFTPEEAAQEAKGDETIHQAGNEQDEQFAEEVTAYQCPSCGAQIMTEPNTAATFCTFCGSPTIIPSKLSGAYRPAQVIPFKISKEQAQEAFAKWCKNGRFTPKDFALPQELEKITGLYVPFWLFDCTVDGGMTANGTRVRTWPMGSYIYTNTKYYNIRRRAVMQYDRVPADGSGNMDDRTMDLLEPYNYNELVQFQMPYLAGFQAEKYDKTPKDVYPRVRERIDQYTLQKMRETIHGYSSVTNTQFQNTYRGNNAVYTLLPVWIHRYRYEGQVYQFAKNGQTGKIVGKPTVDKSKVAAWFAGIGSGILAVLFAGGMLML
ncbi:MAG: hypothetical protein IJ315_00530 [Firmicutes bacterium]|nr:hypothetical protein [Bacillota bacterium]